MHTRSTDALPLAPRPSLEQYKKLAKDLLKAVHTGDVAVVRQWASDWLERLARLEQKAPTFYEREIDDVINDARSARLVDTPDSAKATLAQTQLFIARLHGFESWPRFVKHLEECQNTASPTSQFEAAADAIVSGDIGALEQLLRKNPELVDARSTRDHRATLLHYVAANGHEGFRQRTPKNAVEIARLLLEAGAEPDAQANMYGHKCTTMEMLVSSAHPHGVGVQNALVEVLLDCGADVEGVEHNGSPLLTAFAFHYPKAAETLAARGAKAPDVISAAALGRVDLVDTFVDDDGSLRPGVPLADVPWPSLPKDPKVHLGYALAWAATFGRDDVVELLLRKGVDANGRDGDASALHSAAAFGRLDLVRLLVKHGAALESFNRFDGTVLDGTVWYAFNDPKPGVDYVAVVKDLLALGARTDLYPEMKGYVDLVLAGRRGGGYPS